MVNITEQFTIFTCCTLVGFVSGFIYDLFKALKKAFKVKKTASVFDVAFWVVVLCIFFAVLFKSGSGQMRGYTIIGFVLGFISYILAASRDISPVIEKIILYFLKITRSIFEPVIKFSRFIGHLMSKLSDIVQNTQKKVIKIVKKRLEKLQ